MLPVKSELPDPLVMLSGKAVTTKDQWFKERRPELKKLFEHYMYGAAPAAPKISSKIERIDPQALGGKATLEQWFFGQVMRGLRGRGNPQLIRAALLAALEREKLGA